MPPKRSSGKEKAIQEEIEEEEEPLQAVILADSFDNRFKPLTLNTPRCLLPVCNAPLLDWTFEALALAGVVEVFVVCRSHADDVKAAISASKWSKSSSGLKVLPVVTTRECLSAGDAMREIYTHGFLKSDFVLVAGDLVSNVRLDEVVRVHRERRKANRDAIMTIVVKEAGARHRTRSKVDSGVFVLDENTQECLHYEPIRGFPPQAHANVPREVLNDHPDIEIRNDLIDCYIDICSVEVPSLFQDNFDYHDIRSDFVHGVLTSDLLMKNIYCHVVTDGYAARVKDTKSYASITKDVLARWTFPVVPNDNHPGSSAPSYELTPGNTYLSLTSPPQLARTARTGPQTLLGPGAAVSADARVVRSVLGADCALAPGASVSDSVLWDNVRVGPRARVDGSILGRGVVIGQDARVERGCLVADGVVLGSGARLARFTRVSARPVGKVDEADEELHEVIEAQTDSMRASLGAGSNGLIWPDDLGIDEVDSDSDEDTSSGRGPGRAKNVTARLLRLGDDLSDLELSDAGSVTASESEDESDEEDGTVDMNYGASSIGESANGVLTYESGLGSSTSTTTATTHLSTSTSLTTSLASSTSTSTTTGLREFASEAAASLARAFSEGHRVGDAAMELKTLRMASNVPLRNMREAVVSAIVGLVPLVADGNGNHASQRQRQEIARVVQRWGPLVDAIGGKDSVETVSVLQEFCATSPRMPLFGQILAALYQEDIVEEDDIRKWHALPASRGASAGESAAAENMRKLWAVGSRMIAQFDAQDDSEESGEEADDGDGSESGSGSEAEAEESD